MRRVGKEWLKNEKDKYRVKLTRLPKVSFEDKLKLAKQKHSEKVSSK